MPSTPDRIISDRAPEAVGPYVHATSHAGVLYCSGSLPLDPQTGLLDNADVASETTRSLSNLQLVCESVGTELAHALRLTIYTTRLEEFAVINQAYADFLGDQVPARTAIGVAALPKGARVEIDAIVAIPEPNAGRS